MKSDECCAENPKCNHGGLPFFGRLLISLIFIFGGIGKIVDFQGAADLLRSFGIHGAEAYIFVGLLMELVGGILLLLGWHTKLGIILLMIFLLPTTLIIHAFWNYEGLEAEMQVAQFFKNLTIYGGLMAFLSFGPGSWSIDSAKTK